jgi:hypothetical protein
MIVDRRVRRQKHHSTGVLPVFNQAEDISVEGNHLLKIVDVQYDVAESFDLWHFTSSRQYGVQRFS